MELLEERTLLSTSPTFQWTGAAGDSQWTTAQNWQLVSGTPINQYPSVAGDIAQFTNLGNTTVLVSSPITVGEIDFNTTSTVFLNQGGSGQITLDNTNGYHTSSIISAPSTNTGSDLIDVPLSAANTPLAAAIAGGTLELNYIGGSIPASPASSFTVNGGSLQILGGNNTGFANITINNGGTLLVSSSGTLANTPTVTVNSGGTLQVNDNSGTMINGRFNQLTGTMVLNGGTFSYTAPAPATPPIACRRSI